MFWRSLIAILLLTGAALPCLGQGSKQAPQIMPSSPETGTIVVLVKSATGASLPSLITVDVYSQAHQHVGTATISEGSARFPDLSLGTYEVEASCPGFETAHEEAELRTKNDERQILLTLYSSSAGNLTLVAPGGPLLAPKVQKELSKALEELRNKNFDEARKNLASAQKAAPNNPDVNYLLGLQASLSGHAQEAQSYWEKAISFDPNHYYSLLALGEAAFRRGELDTAKSLLTRAAAANPNAWRVQELLAHIYLRQGDFGAAQSSSERAIELGKADANSVRLVLAKAYIAEDDRLKAISTLQTFLEGKKTEEQTAAAKKLLDVLQQKEAENAQLAPAGKSEVVETLPLPVVSLVPPPVAWMPPGVDDFVPPVDQRVACNLSAVLDGAEKRVLEFVKSVDSFTATEFLEHQIINGQGIAVSSEARKYNYLVSIKEVSAGIMDVEEYRNASLSLDVFPDHLATRGLPSVILIFHPVNMDGYQFTCEGLGNWRGVKAWQIHFRQKDDRKDLVRVYWVAGKPYPVPLKGRAWIAADTFQTVRIETDLRQPVPQIKLLAEHQSIDYGPVRFRNQSVSLWLPADTDLYMDFRGRRIHRRHSFEDFLLFSVDDKQKIARPKSETPSGED